MLIFGDTFGSTMVVRGALHRFIFKFVRRLRTTLFCFVVENSTVRTTRCVLLTSSNLYPMVSLVNFFLPYVFHAQILTHNPCLSSASRYPVAFESIHVPSSPLSTELDKCNYFKSFRGHQQLASPPPGWLYGTVRIYFHYSTP